MSITLLAILGLTFRTSDYADLAERITGVVRSSDMTATITEADPLMLFRTFITVVLLCRGLVE